MNRFTVYLITCLWVWAPLAQLRAIPLHVFLGGGGAAPAGDYTPYGATFDGTNDYLQFADATNNIAGINDGMAFTLSCWLKFNAVGDGASQYIYESSTNSGASQRLRIRRLSTGKLSMRGYNSGGSEILLVDSTTSVTSASGMVHVMFVVNTAAGVETKKIYINGVSDSLTTTTYTINGTFDLQVSGGTTREHTIGATGAAGSKLNADIFDLWFDDSAVDDPSKFYNAGQPVDLGASGATPTGYPPVFYFSRAGSANSWTNSSGGSSFTQFGTTLGTPATFP